MEDGKRFTRNGVEYHMKITPDDSCDAPWEREDGHGPVSEWTRRGKRPGERVLCEDRGSKRYYDVKAAAKLAKRDGWGVSDPRPEETPTQQQARAVDEDFKRLKAWCDGEWYYVGVVVCPLNEDDEPRRKHAQSLWGTESDAGDYLDQVANELADEVAAAMAE